MMIKLFNKKIAKLYIALICVMLVLTVISSGFCIHYSSEYSKLVEKSSSSGSLTDSISAVLGSLVEAQNGGSTDSGEATEAISSAVSSLLGEEEETDETEKNEELEAAESKKLLTIVLTVVSAALLVAFSAFTVTSYQYEKYLDSPKYKAKLKRMKKLEKNKAN